MKVITTKKYNQFIDRINQLELELFENRMNLTTSNATVEAQMHTIKVLKKGIEEARNLRSVIDRLADIVLTKTLPTRKAKGQHV